MTRPDPRLVAQAIGTRLTGVTNAVGYYGRIGRPLPTQKLTAHGGTIPADPPLRADQSVAPYFLYVPSGPGEAPDQTAGGCDTGSVFRFTVTCVGADVDDVLALTSRVDARLHGWTPTVTGTACGLIRHPVGYIPTPVLTDQATQPPRLYTVVSYETTATT